MFQSIGHAGEDSCDLAACFEIAWAPSGYQGQEVSELCSPSWISLRQSVRSLVWAPAWTYPIPDRQRRWAPFTQAGNMQTTFAAPDVAPEVVSPTEHRRLKVRYWTPR